MPRIPRETMPDSTLALLRDPYRFISRRCRAHGSDLFAARIMLQYTVCTSGAEAARVFYDESRFRRGDAAPVRLQKTLFGTGGIQGLDDEAHRQRRRLWLSLVEEARVRELADTFAAVLREHARRWQQQDGGDIVFYEAIRAVLAEAVLSWSGVPWGPTELGLRTRQLAALYEGAGAVGAAQWRARRARRQTERWLGGWVRDVRRGIAAEPPPGSPAGAVLAHLDVDGSPLDEHVAAVELLNLLRPTVAVAVYATFVALSLHEHPDWRDRLHGEPELTLPFVQEVRRIQPFFPFVAARVRRDFDWRGHRLREGTRVLLDLYGTNHDARTWQRPDEFVPERFTSPAGAASACSFVPQGGGEAWGHRCPGEPIAVALMAATARFLVEDIVYEVPQQSLGLPRGLVPALPRSRLRMRGVTLRGGAR